MRKYTWEMLGRKMGYNLSDFVSDVEKCGWCDKMLVKTKRVRRIYHFYRDICLYCVNESLRGN